MNILSGLEGNGIELELLIDKLSKDKECKSILILGCDANGYTPENINGILQNCPVPLFGGIFPEIILNNKKLSKGVIAAGINIDPGIAVIQDLSNESADYETQITKNSWKSDISTMFVFADGMSGRISALIEGLFNTFGLGINFIGGGAGSLSFVQKPCIITNQGLLSDTAVLAGTTISSGIGVKHGWSTVQPGLSVTESLKNKIKTINWKPAFEIYRNIVENHSGKMFSENEFFNIAKSYPFGIRKLGAENIVRDPLLKEADGTLVCVGEVPQNSPIEILSGDKNSLINAAEEAKNAAKRNFMPSGERIETLFFIDCISRVLFLEDAFQDELNKVYDKDLPMIGALTLGEIANSGNDYLEFYNKTAVVGILNQ